MFDRYIISLTVFPKRSGRSIRTPKGVQDLGLSPWYVSRLFQRAMTNIKKIYNELMTRKSYRASSGEIVDRKPILQFSEQAERERVFRTMKGFNLNCLGPKPGVFESVDPARHRRRSKGCINDLVARNRAVLSRVKLSIENAKL
jgi:hypothetical protein